MNQNPLRNRKDPMHKLVGKDAVHELWTRISNISDGFPNETVKHALASMLINCLRQHNRKREGALKELEELHTKMREVIATHYTEAGDRKNIFPFTQNINVAHVNFKGKFFTT